MSWHNTQRTGGTWGKVQDKYLPLKVGSELCLYDVTNEAEIECCTLGML